MVNNNLLISKEQGNSELYMQIGWGKRVGLHLCSKEVEIFGHRSTANGLKDCYVLSFIGLCNIKSVYRYIFFMLFFYFLLIFFNIVEQK